MSKPPHEDDETECKFCGHRVDEFFELEVRVMTTGDTETWKVCDVCYDYLSKSLSDDYDGYEDFEDSYVSSVDDLWDEQESMKLFGSGLHEDNADPRWRLN